MPKILIVDDEQDVREILDYNLKKAGYETALAKSGNEALDKALEFAPDLILLDVMMPGMSGQQVLRILKKRKELEDTMVLFLTALSDEKSEIEGLKMGADDYLSKPIKMELLLARVKSALRRRQKDGEDDTIVFDGLEINKSRYLVRAGQQEISLAKKEFELLYLLASKPSRVFLRQEILDRVWGGDVIVGDRTIDVHIRKIRQNVGRDVITTVKGVGYKFAVSE